MTALLIYGHSAFIWLVSVPNSILDTSNLLMSVSVFDAEVIVRFFVFAISVKMTIDFLWFDLTLRSWFSIQRKRLQFRPSENDFLSPQEPKSSFMPNLFIVLKVKTS